MVVQQGQTGSQQRDTHEGEGRQSESPSSLGVNEEQGGDGSDDLDGAIAEGCIQGLDVGVAGILEDRRAVE